MYIQLIHGINVESFSNCYASSYFNFKVTHRLIPPSPLTQFFFSSFPSPRMHWASVLQLFYGCVFHQHFYSHRQTIKVCWTHARCPSAGCGSIKSIFLWKWVTISWGGVEQDRKPRRDEIYIRLYKTSDLAASHPKKKGLIWPSDWAKMWPDAALAAALWGPNEGLCQRVFPLPKTKFTRKERRYIQHWADFLLCH